MNAKARSATDTNWMQQALQQARLAEEKQEVPVGAVVVLDNKIIGAGHNSQIMRNSPGAHAEMLALTEAAATLGNYRLPGATLYVTLEPCLMCVGAMVLARIQRLVFAIEEPRTGAVCSCFHCLDDQAQLHRIDWSSGVLADCSKALLQQFFAQRRRTAIHS